MANFEQPLWGLGQFTAAGNYSSATNQYRVMTYSTAGERVFKRSTVRTQVPMGVLQDTPSSGEAGQLVCGGITKFRVTSTASAKFVPGSPLAVSTAGDGSVVVGSMVSTYWVVGFSVSIHSSETTGIISGKFEPHFGST